MAVTVPIGFNFRGSLAYGDLDDVPPDVFAGPAAVFYPTGGGYGWSSSSGVGGHDNAGTQNPKFMGAVETGPATPGNAFQVDLANGTYNIRVALGRYAAGGDGDCAVRFYDGASGTPLLTVFSATALAADNYKDATNVTRTSISDWLTNNVASSVTITAGYLRMQVGTATGYTELAHFSIESAGGGGGISASIRARRFTNFGVS